MNRLLIRAEGWRVRHRAMALFAQAVLCASLVLAATSCGGSAKATNDQADDTGPHAAQVVPDMDANHFKIDHPEQFPCATASEYLSSAELNVTGAVSPDVSRQVPVPSLATGKVLEIDARLGDTVHKGQLLFKVMSTDISGAFSDYRKAVKNEELTKVQLDRAALLFEHGAIAKGLLEVAQNAEDGAKVDLDTTAQHLELLGADPDHPASIVSVNAPVGGVITDQQITNSAGVQALSTPAPFTISDMSHVWIVCDVYENDLAQVRMGELADVHLNAYPDAPPLKGRIGNIGAILDPNLRAAKVRLEVRNNGLIRFGMFVTATFHGAQKEKHVMVPAAAVLHLHDRDWVYEPTGDGMFKRTEVVAGKMLPQNMQEIVSGIAPGTRVVASALVLQNTVEQ